MPGFGPSMHANYEGTYSLNRRLEQDAIGVRLSPNSGARADIAGFPRRAMCGRLRVGKENLRVAGLVGAAMCSAFSCGSHDRWP
jgi:hypothetical protein